ncbi:epimerase [Planctomicrobium sp. SH664]|uniref:epimerase n=1 Tax=Planctomicrobium sp. SH664 TaxID=3448125 RepID=UPI003F5C6D4E
MTTSQVDRGRVVIAGGSGFLGRSLTQHLTEAGWSVVILSRNPQPDKTGWSQREWDARTVGPWFESLEGADALVNLTGRTVDCVKTPENQDEILRSRVESTRVLGEAMRMLTNPPPVWLQMSTAHIYGDPPSLWCDESSPCGYGLAPTVAQAWEQEFAAALLPSQRSVVLRTSFVIGRRRGNWGGALDRLVPLARWGLGGTVGSGTQGMSWIHELDLNRLFERGLTDATMRGTYIASAPHPVPNREFMRTLRDVLGMPIGIPALNWMVRLAAPLMRTDPELALYGRYVVSRRLREEGFEFRFPELRAALQDLLPH